MSAGGIRALVDTLRSTLPVVLELQALGGAPGVVDAGAKGAAWFRVLYSGRCVSLLPLTHTPNYHVVRRRALDVRLLGAGERVMVLDGAHALRGGGEAGEAWLRPLEGFRAMAGEVLGALGRRGGRAALLDAGLVCERGVVREVVRALHERVCASLAGA